MKKLLSVAAALCMSVTLVACGAGGSTVDKNEEAAKEVVNSFFTALQSGDIEKAQSFANETVTDELGKITGAFDEFNTLLDQYNATDETRAKYTSIMPLIIKAVFEKYEITETEKVSDTAYSFQVKNTGVNLDAIEHVDAALDQDAFIEDITDELTEKAQSDGYDAAMSWLMDKLADYMLESLNTYIADQAREENVMNCVVEKVDDKWLVTKMQ
ncbi:MAG: hypothetical protein IKG15_08545 [Solobacterium sp.]|nr:hypothetical protein [Solobacterium sp.]